ncbi:hypothetical protein DH2020_044735 [Rehmannia glutinosa]|uniref:Cytokinin riboside 5'-monophosphate phosphoribohydrolase n=1 Tax=Rehmannia glutinosa TaxID=99300 RepID=A0ABR0UG34_REHGL
MEKELVKCSRFKKVCVFCGSSSGKKDCYTEAALDLGTELVAKNLDLVYGGGSIGLMGLVSEAVHRGGGHVLGIIPRPLVGKEKTGETVGELRMVGDMHERKAEMARHADCFVALPGVEGDVLHTLERELCSYDIILDLSQQFPVDWKISGGYGTLEELLEVITWAQLGIHDKPVGLLNVDGFYNHLLSFIDKAVDDGFIKPYQRHIFVSAPNAKQLLQKLEEYVAVEDESVAKLKW